MPSFMPLLIIVCFTLVAMQRSEASAAQSAYVITQIPSVLGHNQKELWRKVMNSFYGKYDRERKCWISNENGADYCMRPHTLEVVARGGANDYYLVVGGSLAEYDDMECHACAGAMGFLVLTDEQKQMGLVARSKPYLEFGSWGRIPPEEDFAVHRLGPGDNFGWAVKSSYGNQGTMIGSTTLFAIVGDQIRDIGSLPESFSESGSDNCSNGMNETTKRKCSDYSFETLFDSTSGTSHFAPVKLIASGVRLGEPLKGTYTLPFNENTLQYELPSDFPED